jgi:hypothetical protein
MTAPNATAARMKAEPERIKISGIWGASAFFGSLPGGV